MNTVYLQIYFVTIAALLGTGILGLPVTMYKSGFYPFLVVFIFVFIMEALLILIGVEILQKAYAIQIKYDKENQEVPTDIENPPQNSSDATSEKQNYTKFETKSLNSENELLPLFEKVDENKCNEVEDQPKNRGPVLEGHVILSEQKAIRSPDLYLLAEMFLCYGIRHIFNACIVLELATLLIAYSLAGSEAYGEILGIKYIYVIPVFSWSLALFIVFAFNLIQPVVSILTLINASLFTVVVIVTFFVTSEVQENIENNFNYIQDSFLVSTTALGGSFFIMPFLFKKIENDASQILTLLSFVQSLATYAHFMLTKLQAYTLNSNDFQIQKYRFAVLMGLVTCTFVNIFWCWAVIEIVPQHCTPMIKTNQSSHSPILCNSLESANENGEISTEPLTRIIYHKNLSFFWVSKVIEVFIMISTTVSNLIIGTTMHHTICGFVESKLPTCSLSKCTAGSRNNDDTQKKCASNFLSLILFGIAFIIAMWNPKGFLDVIEKFTSFAINSVNFLVSIMFMATRYKENNKLKIPLPLPNMVMPFIFLLPLYFVFAIGYDIYFSVMFYMHHETDKSHLPELQHLHHNSSLLNVTSPLHVNATS